MTVPSETANAARSSDVEPPSYESVQEADARTPLSTTELPSFTLDGKLVFLSMPPSRALYEVDGDPNIAVMKAYGVSKINYKLSTVDGEGYIKSSTDLIYTFKRHANPFVTRNVAIVSQSRRLAYKGEFIMTPVIYAHPVKWRLPGHFHSDMAFLDMFRRGASIRWVDGQDNLLAVEETVTRDKDGKLTKLPRLDIKQQMDVKELDLLVTAWVARFWEESAREKDEREDPMNWAKFKRIVDAGRGRGGNGIYGGLPKGH